MFSTTEQDLVGGVGVSKIFFQELLSAVVQKGKIKIDTPIACLNLESFSFLFNFLLISNFLFSQEFQP